MTNESKVMSFYDSLPEITGVKVYHRCVPNYFDVPLKRKKINKKCLTAEEKNQKNYLQERRHFMF